MDNTELFTNVPVGIDGVFKHVYQILVAHWKPLLGIAGIQIVSVCISTLVLSIFIIIVAASALWIMNPSAFQDNPDRSRLLLDYSTGVSGASRLLFGDELISSAFIMSLIIVILLWIVVITLVCSIFTGAFHHAVAEIYAGSAEPCADRSIKAGIKRMRSVFSFQLIVILSTVGIMLVTIFIPLAYDDLAETFSAGLMFFSILVSAILMILFGAVGIMLLTLFIPIVYDELEESFSAGLLNFGILVCTISMMLFGAAMTAAIPSIIVEGKSPVEAYKRSWNLFKKFFCFIASTIFACKLGVLIFVLGSIAILQKLPPVVGIVGHLAINLLTMMIPPLIQNVLYMSMRIRTENATPADIAQQIGFSLADYSLVQLVE